MNEVEQCDRLARLVRLQRSDEMQFKTCVPLAQFEPFRFGFLHAVLAEDPLARPNHRFDCLGPERLAYRDERDRFRRATRLATRLRDFHADRAEPVLYCPSP